MSTIKPTFVGRTIFFLSVGKPLAEGMKELRSVEIAGWKNEMESVKELFASFGNKLPKELNDQLSVLKKRLERFG